MTQLQQVPFLHAHTQLAVAALPADVLHIVPGARMDSLSLGAHNRGQVMDEQVWLKILGVVVTIMIGVGGWLIGTLRAMRGDIQANTDRIANHRVHVAENYVTRKEQAEMKKEIFDKIDGFQDWMGEQLNRINDKLDGKEDRFRHR